MVSHHPEVGWWFSCFAYRVNDVPRSVEEGSSGVSHRSLFEFDCFLEYGILANGFLHPSCADCAQEKRVAFLL